MGKLLYALVALLVLSSCAQAPTEPARLTVATVEPTPTLVPRAEVIVRPNRRPTPRVVGR